MPDVPALPPLTDADWPPEIADMRDGFAGRLNVYRTMAHNPALLRAWANLRAHVVSAGALNEEQRELVILRTGWHWRSDYEWAHHVWRGRRIGLSDARIESARAQDLDDHPDGILLRATDRLLRQGMLDAVALAEVRALLDDAAIMDVMATIGFYTTLALLLKTFGTPIDAFVLEADA